MTGLDRDELLDNDEPTEEQAITWAEDDDIPGWGPATCGDCGGVLGPGVPANPRCPACHPFDDPWED